jgi:hypothetical protein
MVELNDYLYQQVEGRVVSVIQDAQLQLELIDHCCCHIEEQMAMGVSFQSALESALTALCPDGIQAIEAEVQHILEPQIFKVMKIGLFLSGFVAAFCITVGILFKTLHWPGANVILGLGDASLIVSMLFLLSGTVFRNVVIDKLSFVRLAAGAVGGTFIGSGGLFKLMHWPTANIQFLLGVVIIAFVFLPIFFWQLYQKEMA